MKKIKRNFSDDNQEKILKDILDKIARLEESMSANCVGLQNVYNEFNKYKLSDIYQKIEDLTLKLDHYKKDKNVTDFGLDIKSYPFNIRVNFKIKTNFGEISQIIDYPPAIEYRIGNWIAHMYIILLNKLYQEHEKKGGKYLGEEGFKEFIDKNGETIVNLKSQLSQR